MQEIDSSILKKRVEKHICRDIENEYISGASVFISQCGKVLLHQSYGYSDFETKRPLLTNSVFRIASMSKPIVALAVLRLVDEGKLSIFDKVSDYIPEFKNCYLGEYNDHSMPVRKQTAINEICIINLLNHSSGLGSGRSADSAFFGKKEDYNTLEKAVSFYAKNTVLDFEPESRYSYSPIIAFDVLGRIIEIVSGISFYDYINDNVFKPLEMYDTFYFPDENIKSRIVKMFYLSREGPRNIAMNGISFGRASEKYSPVGAGIYSTAEDYSHVAEILHNGGLWKRKPFLSKNSYKLLITDSQKKECSGCEDESHFTLGMTVDLKGHKHRAEGTLSWGGAYGTTWFADISNKITAIYMKNSYYASLPYAKWGYEFEDDVYSSFK